MGRKNIRLSDLSEESGLEDNAWTEYGFDAGTAAEWMRYGFYDPATAQEWDDAVDSPEEAAAFMRLRIAPDEAIGWIALSERRGRSHRVDDLINAVDGKIILAMSYDRHFEVDDWAYLHEAGVTERASASVYQLVSAIEARGIDASKAPEREEVIHEAVSWLGSGTDYSLTRTSLLQNLIMRGMRMRDVQFVLSDQDSSVSADAAIRANQWVEEAKFELDDEGISAYRLLAHRPDVESKELAVLIKNHGVRAVVAALETGLKEVAQLEYYLQHGGVAEISRGAL